MPRQSPRQGPRLWAGKRSRASGSNVKHLYLESDTGGVWVLSGESGPGDTRSTDRVRTASKVRRGPEVWGRLILGAG